MIECCIDGCDHPGTVHANHPDASLYCVEHGVCAYCGESVEFFVPCQDLHIWICPCVEKRRKQATTERPKYEPVPVVTTKKKAKNVKDHWQRTA